MTDEPHIGYLRVDAIDENDPGPPGALLVLCVQLDPIAGEELRELEGRAAQLGTQLLDVVDAAPGARDLAMTPQAMTACLVQAQAIARAYLDLARQVGREEGDEAGAIRYALEGLHQASAAADTIIGHAGRAEPVEPTDGR